jgi:ribosomal RNA-processing protein 8
MFAVDGWKLPTVVPQKAEKRRSHAQATQDDATRPKKRAKVDKREPSSKQKHVAGTDQAITKVKKDKSKYLPKYGKEEQTTTSNMVPVAAVRKKRTPTPEPVPEPAVTKQARRERQEKKILARPPRSERDATPPKLLAVQPPPDVQGLGEGKQLTPLQRKMAAKLSGARFRWINEKLYTTTGADALALISEQPDMFEAYHAGFRKQVKDWPSNPVDLYKRRLEQLLKESKGRQVVVDLGCGEAKIAERLQQLDPREKRVQVRSFDLLAANERIEACDIANLPMKDGSADIAIFCLALMGTDFVRFLQEAHRVLKPGGLLWIAEIKSRFNDRDGKAFIETLSKLGFTLTHRDDKNKMFVSLDFTRGKDKKQIPVAVSSKVGSLLKPCTYKKR